MSSKDDLPGLFEKRYSYSGRVLKRNHYSTKLKKRLAKAVVHLDALERIGTPIVTYIAAWEPGNGDIWYEYAGSRLRKMLGCKAGGQLAEAFRENLSKQYLYRKNLNNAAVIRNVTDKKQLEQGRQYIRRLAEKTGKSEATYKVDLNGKPCWLKDLARIETYPDSEIVLSIGSLSDVTDQMRLEETLSRTRKELEYHRNKLESLVNERTAELHEAQLEVVNRLVQAAEFRDDQTGSHNKRLSMYCSIIGEAYGLTKGANWLLYHAVPMHDVGKLGISDSILLKEGPLTPGEYDVIKGHCELGSDLLDGGKSDLLKVARTIALTHHEHWDGSGYPSGLRRGQIPLAGRIAAVCDVFDALTSERPYKKAWKFDEAVREIARLRGVNFDPEIVDVFMNSLSDLKRVYMEYAGNGECGKQRTG
ncbi:MAG: HD domain-containing phosphohydrolase [Desulfobacteraceae bacterium]